MQLHQEMPPAEEKKCTLSRDGLTDLESLLVRNPLLETFYF